MVLAAIVTAGLFALQHLPIVVANDAGPFVLVVLFVVAISFRALIAWAHDRTGILLVVGLPHAAGDAIGSGLIGDGYLPRLYQDPNVGLLGMVAEVLIGLVVIVGTRARLGLHDRRPSAASALGA